MARSGSKFVTLAESTTNSNNNDKFELCDVDFFGGFEKFGVCPKK